MRRKMRFARPLSLLCVVALAAAACGGGGSKSSSKTGAALKGASYTVGGKEFTEQKILCELTAQALTAAGAKVKKQCGLSGSATVRTALTSGRIDMYWEYTGTGWITHLKHTKPIQGSKEQYDAVAKEDLETNKIKWLAPAPFDNTYAIGVKEDNQTDVKTLSDLGKLAQASPDKAKLCVATEFVNRDDGLPGLEKTYNFKVPRGNLATLEEGAIYNSIKKKDPCNFGEVFTTDGRIKGLGLRVLDDDKKFFPVYNPALTLKESTLTAHPALQKIIEAIAKALDTKTMQQMNSDVDNNGDQPADVAKKFLKDHNLD